MMRKPFAIACALVCLPANAQPLINEAELWMHDFIVLTMSPRGDWGVGVDPYVVRAIKMGIDNCRKMSGTKSSSDGCGAYFSSIRAGWSLGIRCGSQNIIVADRNLAQAEQQALAKERELREKYDPEAPTCVRVVTVTPGGFVIRGPQIPAVAAD
jgi:hypothetical protein